jgi:hypothetical protein
MKELGVTDLGATLLLTRLGMEQPAPPTAPAEENYTRDSETDAGTIFKSKFAAFIRSLLAGDCSEQKVSKAVKESGIGVLGAGLKTISKLFDRDYLYVRDCYPKLLIRCLSLGKEGCVCISGDPGIGKSFFAFYVFLALRSIDEKVVLVHQSGSAYIFDGQEVKFERDYRGAEWANEDCWLLLDGRAKERFISKRKRGVVFASPRKSNYYEFIKQNGSVLYMSPWPWDEVEDLVTQEKLLPLMQNIAASWYRRTIGSIYDDDQETEADRQTGDDQGNQQTGADKGNQQTGDDQGNQQTGADKGNQQTGADKGNQQTGADTGDQLEDQQDDNVQYDDDEEEEEYKDQPVNENTDNQENGI